ncbi:MAG: (Fe-S)-binding protein [Rhizobiaceae bacterium]|nr:(Fe-S)-binding protein [Rhizobiaceae bacterium]
MSNSIPKNPRVALFVTCLVDLFRPSVGFASVKLLEDAGCDLEVPMAQTCCGQPAWNSGDRADTRDLAEAVIRNFEDYDYIVAPSGSCAGMLKKHYPEVFKGDPIWESRVERFSEKVYELTSFLVDVLKVEKVDAILKADITYHDSCAGLRELGIQEQPRKLVKSIKGVTMTEMKNSDVCCGFGGTFAVKYSEISNSIVTTKTEHIEETSAQMLLAGDLGCLLNMAGKLRRENSSIEVRHVAEVLAGMVDNAPIGERTPKGGGR